ncbi:glucans biosynthesis protein [Novosphingobium sp. CF614]|uniref:glucan biosynthesis protein n=1 Tax=Novosphingobium sp. CF614 TaxID=1884364 RepID=UPI0008DF4D23|nr:glucan biosynthesis protein [Novosphingobium sp. CF614]SFG51372.1 glucans biosynthesis protein [Novosphingobium sp. CF614]
MSRRTTIRLFASLAAVLALPEGACAAARERLGPSVPFSWDRLVERARRLARKAYAAAADSVHAAADYDATVGLTYGEAEAVAGNVRLFPTSRATAPKAVHVAVVENGKAREIVDTAGLFVGSATADPAGFRVMDASGRSDWLAWQGASYFRASGSQDQYGLSARGIAIDTGLSMPEEFPSFTHFWIERIGPDQARVHALLDGPSLTGAYAFDCRKGDIGVTQDVTAVLFLRKNVTQLGLAPASSMFWYDQSSPPAQRDWRPEIHDSDGLAIWAGNGERIWRPLENPSTQRLHSMRADSPRGFGLLQRDQDFDHYQDDGVFYDRRPSLWVEPRGDWGPGSVCLFEMPTDIETLDNIAMFWRGDAPARAGERRDFAYRLTWTSRDPTAGDNARCVDVFDGPAGIPGAPPIADARKFVFDFAGPSLAGLGRGSGVVPATDLPQGVLMSAAAYPVARAEARWRVMLDVRTQDMPQPQFRLYLKRGDTALSETVIKAIEP